MCRKVSIDMLQSAILVLVTLLSALLFRVAFAVDGFILRKYSEITEKRMVQWKIAKNSSAKVERWSPTFA